MNYELSRDIIYADRAWHVLEQQLAADAEKAGQPDNRLTEIVDVDTLAFRGTPLEFADREAVRTKYTSFLTDPRLDETGTEFTRRRLSAQLFHLALLDGEKTDIFSHIETAMSTELVLVDEAIIDSTQEALDEQLREHGLGFDASYAELFQEKLGLEKGGEAMTNHLADFARRSGALAIGEKPENSLAIPQIVEVDKGWVGYFGTDETGKPYTELNAHERHSYTRGRAAAISAHEARGHASDFAYKHRAVKDGDMDPLFGITNYFAPENVTAETIALGREQQSLRDIEGDDAWEYHFQADYHDYLELVRNNALIYINTGVDEDTVVEYLKSRYLPNEKEENLRGVVQDMRDDLALRAYTGSYAPGMRIVRQALKLPSAQQEAFFREIQKYPYSEAQMQAMLTGQTALKLAA